MNERERGCSVCGKAREFVKGDNKSLSGSGGGLGKELTVERSQAAPSADTRLEAMGWQATSCILPNNTNCRQQLEYNFVMESLKFPLNPNRIVLRETIL